MQRLAAPGAILVADAAWRAAGAAFVGRRAGPLGSPRDGAACPVYTLLHAAGARGPDAPEPTPLVGRAAELAALQAAWQAAHQGQGRVVTVVGEAGLGKSRLLREFARTLAGAELLLPRRLLLRPR